MKEHRSYAVVNCDSEEFHPTHTWRQLYTMEEVWCWGWTHDDEFYKIIDEEWDWDNG